MEELKQEIQKIITEKSGKFEEKKDTWKFEVLIAERKAFLSSKKLIYKGSCKIDPEKNELKFSEMLLEKAAGLSGGDLDSSPGFGFKTESSKLSPNQPPERVIEEQSKLFGKTYQYKFDLSEIRSKIRDAAAAKGLGFRYCLGGV